MRQMRCLKTDFRMEAKGKRTPGRRISFAGTPVIPHPQIGSVYRCHVEDFGVNNPKSRNRPMICVGYYVHEGKTIALDFICPTSQFGSWDKHDRFHIELPDHRFADFRQCDVRIDATCIVTLPNNPESILKSSPIDKISPALFPDYLLRKMLTLYEEKARWKKDAAIPEGAMRHGFILDEPSLDDCRYGHRLLPDLPDPNHKFGMSFAGPKFIQENMEKIRAWAEKAHLIREASGVCIDLPPIKTFPDWPKPESLVTCRDAQWKCLQALSRSVA